nr:hypothetical protein [Pelovirga terrestris]
MVDMTISSKKHPCPDCRQCQWCSDERCRLCLKSAGPPRLSIREQIALFERLNRHCNGPQNEEDEPTSTG